MVKIFTLLVTLFTFHHLHAQQQQPYHPSKGKVHSVRLSTGVTLNYIEQGNTAGIPVILLHGFTDSWHSYETVLPLLSSSFHVFALTQRGHGDSQKPNEGYQPADFAADLAAFMKQKKIRQAIIAGHSMGGVIAQQFAVDYPSMVKGLVIIGSDASFKDNPGVPEFSEEISRLRDTVSYEFANGFQQSTCANPLDPAYYNVLVNETMKVPAHVWKSIMNGLMNTDLTDRLKEIKVPVMILWGDKDGFCTRGDQEKMRKEIRHADLIIYEDTGHAMHWEQPARFAADLSSFITKYFVN